MKTRVLSSLNLVLCFVENFPEKIKKIYITKNKNEKYTKIIQKKGFNIEFLDDPLTTEKKGVHQHIWAEVREFYYHSIEDLKDDKRVLILDQISDPHNFGSMARTAYQLGFESIILQTRNCVSVTPTVSRISTGAVDFMKVTQVTNIRNAMKKLKSYGFEVYATDMKGIDISKVNFAEKSAIIMGNEGKGVRYMVKEDSDYIISIPMSGKLDSMNVSNTFAIVAWQSLQK